MQSGTVPPVERLLLEVSDVVNTTLDSTPRYAEWPKWCARLWILRFCDSAAEREKPGALHQVFHGLFARGGGAGPGANGRRREGLAAERREAVLINDTATDTQYIEAMPNVRSELALPSS